MSDPLPVVSSLTPVALEARREGLLRDLVRRAQAREERPEGYCLVFRPDADVLAGIRRHVDAGRFAVRRTGLRGVRGHLRRGVAGLALDGGAAAAHADGPVGRAHGAGVRSSTVEDQVIYDRHDEDILITRVLHGRRNQAAAWSE